MPTSTDVTKLNINELTETQYDAAVLAGTIGANDLSFLTDVNVETQVSTMPAASADELGKVYQFIGTTDANYTHGYFYECVSDGLQPATYSWSNVQVQANSGGLPSQTGNAGKFLTTDGTDASWGNGTHQSLYFRSSENVQYGARIFSSGGQQLRIVAVNAQGQDSGYGYSFSSDTFRAEGNNFNLGDSVAKWGNTYTKKINNGGDITVPAVAGEMAVKQVNATITLAAADWSSNTQTVNVTGMTATGVVMVSPDPTDQSAYTSAGILCTAQAAGTLTFTCDTVPSADIDVNVVCL